VLLDVSEGQVRNDGDEELRIAYFAVTVGRRNKEGEMLGRTQRTRSYIPMDSQA